MGDFVIQARKLTYSFHSRSHTTEVISEIDISLYKGEILGILGPNGCGKSTLLRLLARLEPPSSGDVTWEGSGHPGMIFQSVEKNLVPWLPALSNIALPAFSKGDKRTDALDKARRVLKEMGLEELASRRPKQMSGGQQQLISLARWIANPPPSLLVDEGWSMLDVIQRERAQKLLRLQLADTLGVGVCVVSHDLLDLSRIADRVLILTSRPSRVSTLIELDRTSEFSTRSSILWRAAQNILGTPL